MLKNNPVLVLIVIVVLIFASTQIINHFLNQSLEEKRTVVAVPTASVIEPPVQQVAVPVHKIFPLVPSDPAQYGIILTDPAETPKTPEQWDIFVEQALTKNKVLEQEGALPAIEVMKKKPEEFAARQQEIDERIKLFEEQRARNPSDEEAQHHLDELYVLKSLGKILKDKVTAPKRDDIKIPDGIFPQQPSTSPAPAETPTTDKIPGFQLTP